MIDVERKSRTSLIKALVPQILLLPVLAWLVWGIDLWRGVSLQFSEYSVVVLFTCGLLLLPWALVRRPAAALVPGVWLAFLLVLPFVTNSSLKPLLRGVRDLEPGMGRDAVLQTLKERYAGTNYPEPVVFSEEASGPRSRILIKPQGRDRGFQAESLLVFLEDGRFRHAEFLAD